MTKEQRNAAINETLALLAEQLAAIERDRQEVMAAMYALKRIRDGSQRGLA